MPHRFRSERIAASLVHVPFCLKKWAEHLRDSLRLDITIKDVMKVAAAVGGRQARNRRWMETKDGQRGAGREPKGDRDKEEVESFAKPGHLS